MTNKVKFQICLNGFHVLETPYAIKTLQRTTGRILKMKAAYQGMREEIDLWEDELHRKENGEYLSPLAKRTDSYVQMEDEKQERFMRNWINSQYPLSDPRASVSMGASAI